MVPADDWCIINHYQSVCKCKILKFTFIATALICEYNHIANSRPTIATENPFSFIRESAAFCDSYSDENPVIFQQQQLLMANAVGLEFLVDGRGHR